MINLLKHICLFLYVKYIIINWKIEDHIEHIKSNLR